MAFCIYTANKVNDLNCNYLKIMHVRTQLQNISLKLNNKLTSVSHFTDN